MLILWKGMKVTFALFLLLGLMFASGLYTVLLYAKITGKDWFEKPAVTQVPVAPADSPSPAQAPAAGPSKEQPKSSALLSAPAIKQYPELPTGCEVTSLTMLLQFAGIHKEKTELAGEMKKDETPIRLDKDGNILYWGNPNVGFVGDVTGKSRGFGIYHGALFPLLQKYVPTAVDLTGSGFDALLKQVAAGVPVVAWTTSDFTVPDHWVVWNTPTGPFQTTFAEHAVLLVGYNEASVFVNDPITGKQNVQIDRAQFIASWEAMGKQALSYTK
jgi:uncharacterized protein YvpB